MEILAILGQFFLGVGVMLIGCAAMLYVTVYSKNGGE